MRALVTGAEGFVGAHLAAHLEAQGDEVVGTRRPGTGTPAHRPLDVTDGPAVRAFFEEVAPEAVYHLAAITFVPHTMDDPAHAFAVNAQGSLHVLEAARGLPTPPRVLLVSSAEVYGLVEPADVPLAEERSLAPRTPYAASKAAMEMLALGLAGLPSAPPVLVARAFNHTGPGQSSEFVCSSFARQLAQVERGEREPTLRVGNLEALRDFTDVRDVVRAYAELVRGGVGGRVYNVASGRPRSIRSVLEGLVSRARVPVRIETDPSLLRPVDLPVLAGSTERIRRDVGWTPRIDFDDTLADLLEDWRGRLGEP